MDNMKEDRPLLTILVPVFNESATILLFFKRLEKVLFSLSTEYRFNVLFLNNASSDSTLSIISELRHRNNFVYFVTLSTNVGYQKSIDYGLRIAKGDLFVIIDVDCEDPPEMIKQFIEEHNKGFDLVYGIRKDRHENVLLKKLRKLFYHIVRKLSDEEIILYMAEFALFTNEVRSAVVASSDSFPFVRSTIARVGFTRKGIPYKRDVRIAGKTNYNFYGMLIFAIASVLSSTTLPLRLPIYTLPFWTASVVGILWLYFITPHYYLLLLCVLLICIYIGGSISFIALYLGRVYKNSLNRPNAFIHKNLSFLQDFELKGD
jgi:glycosyltransferase involved in cell wall biosynthesis